VTFQVRVTSIPASPAPARYDATASFTYQYVSCAGQPTQSGSFTTNTVTTGIARIEANKNTTPATVVAGVPLRYNITIQNTGTAPATGVTLTDPIPAGTTYTPNSTAEDGIAVPDVGGTMPFALGRLVNSFGQPPGVIGPNQATTVIFFVSVDPAATGTLTNTALVDPDGTGPLPPFAVPAVSPVGTQADLSVTKDGPDRAVAGSNLVFTVTVTNRGPSVAAGVTVSDPTPPGLVFVSNSGDCTTVFPCALGNLAPGATRTITTTLSVPSGYVSPDPIVNLASVSSPTPDPAPDNNSAEASVGVNAPVANLTISKSNGVTSVTPGRTTTYTITVGNTGPSDVSGVQVTDPQSAVLSNFTWTCSASGGASCAAASGTGALNTTVNLPAGTSATFLLTATVAAEARGEVTNTAQADSPAGVGGTSHVTASDTDQLAPLADMSVTKAGPPSAVPGNDVVYTLVVHNGGPSSAVDVSVNDPTPPGLTLVSTTGDCTTAFPCSFGTLPSGANRTIVATYSVPLGYTSPNPILNMASIVDATPDPNQSNRSTTSQTPVVLDADVAVSKSLTPTTALVGDTVTMFVSVLNNGPNRASGIVVTDVLPAGLTFVSASPQQGTYVPSSGQWQVGDLQNGGNATLIITARVTQPGTIINTSTKTGANEPDPDTSNDSAIATLNAAASADVAIEKRVDNPTPSVGQDVTFTVTTRNTGPSDASGVTVSDALPPGLALVSATPSQGTTYDAGTGAWTVGALQVSAFATLTLVASVNTPGVIVNTANKTAQTEADLNPANDQSSVSLNAVDTADIQVTKAISNPTPAVDQQVTFTVTATNLGPSPATGVAVTDQLPAGLTFVSATPSQGDYDPATGVWTVGSVAASQSAVLSLTALVTQTGGFTNTARKTAGNEPDPNPGNDSGSVAATASRVADLSVTKTDAVDSVVAGLTDTYTITVANAGPSAVTGASVVDTFPTALTGVTWTCEATDGGTCAVASGAGNIATTVDLPAGASATFTATGTVSPSALGMLANTANVSPPPGTTDPTPGDETASDATTITPLADLQVTKAVTPSMVTAGNTATFTIVVTNAGPSTATGVVITDPPPAGLAFDTITGACTAFPCTVPTLAPGASATVTATVAVPSPYTGPDPIVNAATASSAVPDPVSANDVRQASVSVMAPVADLTVGKSNRVTRVVPGSRTTYTITVTNGGPDPVSGAQVKDDPLPAALTGATWTCTASGPTGASCGQPSGSGAIEATVNLPVGATATFVLQGTVSPDATGTLANTANAENPSGVADPTPSIATDTDPLTPQADVSVTKTGPGTVVPGNTAVYAIVVTNSGPSTATNVVVNDPTPTGLTFVSNGGACTTDFPCQLGTIAPGGLRTIVATYTALARDTVAVNTAAVTGTIFDRDPDNNFSHVMTQLVGPPPPTSTSSTTPATTTSTTPELTTTTVVPTTTTLPAAEVCDNCRDDNGNGLVDAEDPACCTAQPLTFTQARFRPGKSTLRATATLADGAFASVDPRVDDVRVQIRTDSGEQVCCAIGKEHWQRLFGQTFGFFDQKMTLCPPLRCVKLAVPKNGQARATVIVGRVKPGSPLLSSAEVTIDAGSQCASGQLTLHPKGKRGAVFP
jgi:large repetitive protein